MVICLERRADSHMARLTPLPLTVSCFSKIQIGFTFLVPAYPGSPRKRAVKQLFFVLRGTVFSHKRYLGNDKLGVLWAAKLQLVGNVGE